MKVEEFFSLLTEYDISCYCGVPDSLLKDLNAYIIDNVSEKHHTITANEGNAIALASGHYLATGKFAVVYMQNSGLGNCVNPLLSLNDEEVYKIPLLMLIGWRGEPGTKDEPQHIKQGKVTTELLQTMGIEYLILPSNFKDAKPLIKKALLYIAEERKPFAFIIKKGTFDTYSLMNKKSNSYTLTREGAIKTIIKALTYNDIIVSTTGHISREVYETRKYLGQSNKQDFLTVGSMGHASSIALGIAIEKADRNIYCFDGDGALLMHQGALSINSSKNLTNFKHIIFNNEAHDSVGSWPTAIYMQDVAKVALNCGYKKSYSVSTKEKLENILPKFILDKTTSLLEIKVKCGARADLGRPKEKPQENKEFFMANLNQIDFIYNSAIENLSKLLKEENAKKILIFTGKNSYKIIKPIIEKELKNVKFEYYNDFSINPKECEIKAALKNTKNDFDMIVSIGGGSVIDFAKAYKWYLKCDKKHIAIPTTAGTGSEATQFAVVYVNDIKTSLDDKSILPNFAIIDSQFVLHNPRELKISAALDTLCQAIESYWAVKSTPISREFAKRAMELCKDYLVKYINNTNINNAEKMMEASNYAGKAINISRTTAAHAFSYKITNEYGVSHGKAVALNIANIMESNSKISNKNCIDKRGAKFVSDRISDIYNILGIENPSTYFDKLFKQIKFDTKQYDYIDKKLIATSVNKERLANNPCDLQKL